MRYCVETIDSKTNCKESHSFESWVGREDWIKSLPIGQLVLKIKTKIM
jgi:hypothetical protein